MSVVDAIGNFARGLKDNIIGAARNLHNEGSVGAQIWGPFKGSKGRLGALRDDIRSFQARENPKLQKDKQMSFWDAAWHAPEGQGSRAGKALENFGSDALNFFGGTKRVNGAWAGGESATTGYERALLMAGRSTAVAGGLAVADFMNPFGFGSIRD